MDEKTKKETIEEAIALILEEGHTQGYFEAMEKFKPEYKKLLSKGRRQGFIGCLVVLGVATYFYFKISSDKKKPIEHVTYVHDENESDYDTDVKSEEE